MDNTFKGAAKRITDIDIPRVGAIIRVGEDEIHAFMDVEAAGQPFDAQGRPKMLREGHKFYKNLTGAKRAAAVKAKLAWPKWDPKGHPYPGDSYPWLIKAMAIDEAAALKSCSWGLTQIMGEYYADCGYASVQAMVQAFMDDAAAHLEATVKLLIKWKVDDDLRAHRWAVVAETWNGSGYKANNYDVKLARAFAKWQKIRDTPWPPKARAPGVVAAEQVADELAAGARPVAADSDPAAPAVDKATIERVQQQLKDLGYTEVGGVSGVGGTMTSTAIRAFRAENGLPDGDEIDDALLLALQKAKPRVLAPARTNASPEVVREKVPEAKASWWTKVTTFFGSIGALIAAAFNGLLGNVDSARGTVEPLMSVFSDVPGWVWFSLFGAVLFGLFLISRHGEAKSIEAFQSGERR